MSENKVLSKQIYFASLSTLIFIALLYGKVEQPQSYYQFADDRTFFGIPNGLDVMSNLAIVYPAIIGLLFLQDRRESGFQYRDPIEPVIYYSLFIGFALTFLGSIWFHLNPNDSTLVWDRLGMSVIMACYCSLIIADMYSIDLAKQIHYPLIAIGSLSIIYWHFSGDLRFYFIFKLQPLILVFILIKFGKKVYDRSEDYLVSMLLIGIATLMENVDEGVFESLVIISGHTLKHIFAGASLWWVMRMIQTRELIDANDYESE